MEKIPFLPDPYVLFSALVMNDLLTTFLFFYAIYIG